MVSPTSTSPSPPYTLRYTVPQKHVTVSVPLLASAFSNPNPSIFTLTAMIDASQARYVGYIFFAEKTQFVLSMQVKVVYVHLAIRHAKNAKNAVGTPHKPLPSAETWSDSAKQLSAH